MKGTLAAGSPIKPQSNEGIRSCQRTCLFSVREYSAVTSPWFSRKALKILRERLLKASKHSSTVTFLCSNKTVFTVLVPELKRLNDRLSSCVEMKQISCTGRLQQITEGGELLGY